MNAINIANVIDIIIYSYYLSMTSIIVMFNRSRLKYIFAVIHILPIFFFSLTCSSTSLSPLSRIKITVFRIHAFSFFFLFLILLIQGWRANKIELYFLLLFIYFSPCFLLSLSATYCIIDSNENQQVRWGSKDTFVER